MQINSCQSKAFDYWLRTYRTNTQIEESPSWPQQNNMGSTLKGKHVSRIDSCGTSQFVCSVRSKKLREDFNNCRDDDFNDHFLDNDNMTPIQEMTIESQDRQPAKVVRNLDGVISPFTDLV